MANSEIVLNLGTGGDTLDTEIVNGKHRERVEITGSAVDEVARVQDSAPDGTEHALVVRNIPSGIQEVSISSMDMSLTNTELRATAVEIIGEVEVTQPVAVTDNGGSLTVDGTFFQATQPVSIAGTVAVSGPLSDTQLRATPVPVSGPLTDTQLRATPVPVSGTVTITDGSGPVTVDGTVAVSNFPVLQPVSDNGGSLTVDGTFFQATQPVSIAAPVAVTGTFFQATQPISGTVSVTQPNGSFSNGAETAISSSAVQIIAANSSRKKLIIQNTGASNIRVGITGVTATTGIQVIPNGSLILDMPNCPVQAMFAVREGSNDSIALALEMT